MIIRGTEISINIAEHIESFTDYDFAQLLFGGGKKEEEQEQEEQEQEEQEQKQEEQEEQQEKIDFNKQLNIIQVADLVLPGKEIPFDEYTNMEMLSVAMLLVISTFTLDFIHSDRSVFKIVGLDEAWSFLQVAQGKVLSNKLVRAGRAMNAAVDFITQGADDLDNEKLKNNIGLKFAFRSNDITEIRNSLLFLGVDPDDESNQNRMRNLENGQCLMSDLYGRVGVVHCDYIFSDLFKAFDTRPPTAAEEPLEVKELEEVAV